MTSREPDWEPDVLPGFWQHTITLGPDPHGEGDLVATLVRRSDAARYEHAVLALHGYTDYFFHTELAEKFAERGVRVLRDRPAQVRTLPTRRSDAAFHHRPVALRHRTAAGPRIVAADTGNAKVCLYGHSAGGLIVTLFTDRLRQRDALTAHNVRGLILNSPFFDLHGPAILRTAPTSAALIALARLRKLTVVRKPTEGGYGTSLHRDYGGEFDYNLDWKPLGGFPVTFGWINAIRRGQARLHRGLDVGVPNLILRSDHSVAETPDPR